MRPTRSLSALGLAALIGVGCEGSTAPSLPDAGSIDAGPFDAGSLDARPVDAARLDAQLVDAHAIDARPADLGSDQGARDRGRPADEGVDHGAQDAASADHGVDANPCVAETCNDADDDCDGVIDEGAACVGAVLEGCRVYLEVGDASGESAGVNSGGDAVFHGFGPPGDVDAGDTLSVAWRCDPALAWAQARCRIMLAHADGSAAIPRACPAPGCVSTLGDGQPVALRFDADVDGDDRFGIGFVCADPLRPARAAAIQAQVHVWIATQHRRVGDAGECLDEPRHVRVAEWGFCPGDLVDDEGRHRCASSGGDGAVHDFGVGTVGGIWPDLGPCDTFGVAVTR